MTPQTTSALRRLESVMRRKQRRAHILVVDRETTISFATGSTTNGEKTSNLGPEPVTEAWERIGAAGGRPPTPAELGASGNAKIAAVSWNSPHLVVTGTSAAQALAMMARCPGKYAKPVVRHLARLASCADGSEISELHAAVFGKQLSEEAISELDKTLADGRNRRGRPTREAQEEAARAERRREQRDENRTAMNEGTRTTLEHVEAALRRDALEGCVFLLPSGAVVAFAMTTERGHNCRYTIGERPLRNHLRTALGDETAAAAAWFGRLRGSEPPGVPKPATVWHRPHLVVSEAIGRERLVTIFEHPEWIRPEVLAEVADEIGIESVNELKDLFARATGRPLGNRGTDHFRNITEPAREAARRPSKSTAA